MDVVGPHDGPLIEHRTEGLQRRAYVCCHTVKKAPLRTLPRFRLWTTPLWASAAVLGVVYLGL